MAIYAIATVPLIKRLSQEVTQIWYADDAASMGKIHQIREWWSQLLKHGPGYGYFPNAAKTWLITKDKHLSLAQATFDSTGIQITTRGRPYLGAPIGCNEYVESFVCDQAAQWSSELEVLTEFTKSQPHAAYSALTRGLTSNWSYVTRTTPSISHLLQPMEDVIREKFVPTLTDRPPPNDVERHLFSLPARLGGLAIPNPCDTSDSNYVTSLKISNPLKHAILTHEFQYTSNHISSQMTAKAEIQSLRRQQATQALENLKSDLPEVL